MKKILALVAALSVVMSLVAGGTIAYLTDTDSDKNVMVVGNVSIDQIENFESTKQLLPTQTVKKEVTVKNDGRSDAFVRTFIAFEKDTNNIVEYAKNNTTADWTWGTTPYSITVDNVNYEVYVVNHNGPLAAGETTDTSLESVSMIAKATNEQVAALGAEYTVLVLSQAVQTEGFNGNAELAFRTTFQDDGELTPTMIQGWFVGKTEPEHGFAGGEGTAEKPYLINSADQLSKISDYADKYTYFKVADGTTTLDMTDVGRITLNGSFDGNGVTMNNLTTSLFRTVGKVGVAQDIKISNFTANVNTIDGHALVRNIYNPGETTFENVTLHGYIEGQSNMGSFYNYGTANGDGKGADYTVSFVNTTSDATLVCTDGNVIGGMLGHGYEGADHQLSINMDATSGYSGDMYTTKGQDCYQVMGMCSHGTYILNGVETSRYEKKYPSTALTMAKPVPGEGGYYVTPVSGADHLVVFLNAQVTAYDEQDNKIANKAGMTWTLGSKKFSNVNAGNAIKVFELFESATIVNDTSYDLGYALEDGALTIYSGRSDNYASGTVRLQVNQYDANNNLLATGIIDIYTILKP